MAKVNFSGVATVDMRNKLNGSVYSKNRAGSYVRTKVTPVNPQTVAQQNVRNRLATMSQAWRALAESERQSWIDAAVNFPYTDIFGNSKTLSGFQLFVKLNVNLAITGTAQINSAPTPTEIPALAISALAADDSANTVIVTATTPVPAGFSLVIQATPNVTPGRSFVKNQYRQTQVFAAAAAGPFDISAAYVALFGDPVTGMKVSVRAFLISTTTGQAGIPVAATTIVVA